MRHMVLLRHGESSWNKENRFTGWTDVPLSERGVQEAIHAGQMLCRQGYTFDVTHTSVLNRAIKTLWLVLEEMDLMWLPVIHSWRLNERHYGSLQGLNKTETAAKFGEEQVKIWRRSYDIPPPALERMDQRYPGHERRYAGLSSEQVPLAESLKDTIARFLPYWRDSLAPAIRSGQRVLVVAHGNSIRAMVKYLDGVSDSAIIDVNIPTGIPLVYDLDDELRPTKHYYLGDQEDVKRAMQQVASQAKVKG